MINLSKGGSINLSKSSKTPLTQLKFGLGWDPAKRPAVGGFLNRLFSSLASVEEIDLDASCVMLDKAGQEIDVVWFRSQGLRSKCGNVRHSGDNLTGEGDGDDEVITADITRLSNDVHYLVMTVHSFRGQTFDGVENAQCRVLDQNDNVICAYKLSEKGGHRGLIIGSLKRDGGDFVFTAHGEPAPGRVIQDSYSTIRRLLGL